MSIGLHDRCRTTGHLLDVFQSVDADAMVRKKILVDNPAKLYGFDLQ